MSRSFVGFLIVTLAGVVGCNQAKQTAGDPGVPTTGEKSPLDGQKDDTFKLTFTSQSVKQGDVKEVTVGIKRGTNFEQDVGVTFVDVPAGVTVNPPAATIKHGVADAKVTLKVANEAAPGEYTLRVMGHPTKGEDATTEFKLTVAPKDPFTLSVLLLPPSIRQGESKFVSIGIKREKAFDQDVTLSFANLPAGVTVNPVGLAIRNGDTESKILLIAANDARLGNFTVKVTGHPKTGADATQEFKLTVYMK